MSGGENVVDAVRDVVEGELVDRKVPELHIRWRTVGGFFGIFITSIIAKLQCFG